VETKLRAIMESHPCDWMPIPQWQEDRIVERVGLMVLDLLAVDARTRALERRLLPPAPPTVALAPPPRRTGTVPRSLVNHP
jgi:hypothetical protein